MSSTNEVKRESEAKLSEASANEKYLYGRVVELEKRNQKLEKKVKKLKKKKKELKEEVVKLRRTTPVQHIADDHEASTSDVEVVEETNIGSRQSNLNEEQAVNSDINSNVDDETAFQLNGAAQVEENRGLTTEEAAEEMEVDNSEELDEEAVDNPSGTGSSEVPNQCPQCKKGFSTPGNLSMHIKGVHGPKKECSFCHKMINSFYLKLHIREAHMGDTRECPECKKQISSSLFSRHMQEVHLDFKKMCPQCGKLISLRGWTRHIQEVHQGVKVTCPSCSKHFSPSNLKKHIREVHDDERKPCPFCPKMFHAAYLKIHIRAVHHRERKKCPHCPKSFLFYPSLSQHIKRYHKDA